MSNSSSNPTPEQLSLAEQIANFPVTKCPPGRAENALEWGQCASREYSNYDPTRIESFSEMAPPTFAEPVTSPSAKTSWPTNKKQRKKKNLKAENLLGI